MRPLPRATSLRPYHRYETPQSGRKFHSSARTSGGLTSAALHTVVKAPAKCGAVPEDSKQLKHHLKDGTGFKNPWSSFKKFTTLGYFRDWIWRRYVTGHYNIPDTTPPTIPVHKPTFLPSRRTPALRATWLGHACYYVEFPSGLRVLFDPVFTERCSPVSFLGFKRYTEAPCQVKDIPYIDACVISHAHYDHLSVDAVTAIKGLHPEAHFFAPLGNKKWFTALGIEKMTELDWWEERDIHLSTMSPEKEVTATSQGTNSSQSLADDDIMATISCLPCQHSASRWPWDKDQTLWSSWSISTGGKSLYFGGDSGYRRVPPGSESEELSTKYTPDYHRRFPRCPVFREIGKLRGPFDLGLIPIGAYQPRSQMSSLHANPFDSVNIFKDTKCKRAMGIHWGAWLLTEEDVLEPPRILKDALRANRMPEEGIFDACDIGQSREFE